MTSTAPENPRNRADALPKSWNPGEVEADLYEGWVAAGYFAADASGDKPPYSIVLPPPNVTGNLHMGHALDHTLMDLLTRRKRMQGFEVLWLPGMDHAGIATQNVVEKQLAVDGKTKEDFGRELFVEKVWDWKRESGGAIQGQMRRLGDGVDWERDRFTMDEGLSRAVQTIFKRLYDAGLIYRAERLVNWSPVLQTGISDLEVDHKEVEGELVSLRYGSLNDDEPHVIVATTRVETMLGDTAVAVHPDDERYQALVGTTVYHPITGRQIPIVADDYVDPEFGSGAVKITPAHDPNDFELGLRHNLPMPTIMDKSGKIADSGTEFDGMDRFEARLKIVSDSRARAAWSAGSTPYLHQVGHSERSGEPIEPRLSMQWWVKVEGSPRPPATRSATARSRFIRPARSRAGSNGSTTCTTGTSRASCGGVTASPSGTAPRARSSVSDRMSRPGGLRSGPGRARHLVLLGPVALLHHGLARRTLRNCGSSIRQAFSSPVTTSCSSGSPG